MARRGLKRQYQDYIFNSTLGAAACSCFSLLTNDDISWLHPIFWGIGSVSSITLLVRLATVEAGGRRPRLPEFASIQRVASPDPDYNRYVMKWKPDKKPDEFVFRGLGLPVPISEKNFRRFVGLAINRQRNVYYGSKRLISRTTNDNFRQLKRHEILSEVYFTKHLRPAFLTDEFNSIIEILGYTRLLIGERRQGTSGRLQDEWKEGTANLVSIAIDRWLRLNPTPQSLFSLFRILQTRLS